MLKNLEGWTVCGRKCLKCNGPIVIGEGVNPNTRFCCIACSMNYTPPPKTPAPAAVAA